MGFIKVQHKDGREAEVTAGEVAFYRSIGFKSADGSVIESADDPIQAATATVQAPANGTDQRLDLVLDELRGLRADIAATYAPFELGTVEPADGDTIELREPGTSAGGENSSDEVPSLEWSRPDLDAYAADHGVADADKLPNKQAVLDAIPAAKVEG